VGHRKAIYLGAWPSVLEDMRRLGATDGEVRRIAEMVDLGWCDIAFSLVESVLDRLRAQMLGQPDGHAQ
jgi:hypothetical protein